MESAVQMEVNKLFDPLLMKEPLQMKELQQYDNVAFPGYEEGAAYYNTTKQSYNLQYENILSNDVAHSPATLLNIDNNTPVLNIQVSLANGVQMPQQNNMQWQNQSTNNEYQLNAYASDSVPFQQTVFESPTDKPGFVKEPRTQDTVFNIPVNYLPTECNGNFIPNCLDTLTVSDLLPPSLDIVDFTTVLENMSGSMNSMHISF